MANNDLLNGLSECWLPNPGLYLQGMVAGLNTSPGTIVTYENQAGFPGGKCLQRQNTTANSEQTNSDNSSLLASIGFSDFLIVSWYLNNLPQSVSFWIGENANNGVDWSSSATDIVAEIPGADHSYQCQVFSNQDPNGPFAYNTPNMQAVWYDVGEATLYSSVNAGTVYEAVNTSGIGPTDPINGFWMYFQNVANSLNQVGLQALWQGAAGVANALSQLTLLYAKLPFDQWDHAGGGGGITYSTSTGRRAGMGNNPPMSMVGAYRRGGYGKR